MSSYSQMNSGAPPGAPSPPTKKPCYKKGLGFVPNSLESCTTVDPITELINNAPKIAQGHYAHSKSQGAVKDVPTTVPLFDLQEMSEKTGDGYRKAVNAFGSAFMQVGVVGIFAPNLSQMVEIAYKEMNLYFRSPLEVKLLNWKKGVKQSGYYYLGAELAPHAPRPDLKESFFVNANFQNWPSKQRNFAKIFSEYYSSLSRAYQYVMMFLMEFLEETYDEALFQQANNALRLVHYPPLKPGDDPKGQWSAPNRDKSVLSLSSIGSIPGLQFYSNRGAWEPVIVPPNYFIASSGLLLQHKTAGLIKARWKRVVNPGGMHVRMPRSSTVFYGTWPDHYSLKPFIKSFATATSGMSKEHQMEYLKKYPDILVQDK